MATEIPQSTIEAATREVHKRFAFFRDPYAVSEKSPLRSELSLGEIEEVQRYAIRAALDEGGVVLASQNNAVRLQVSSLLARLKSRECKLADLREAAQAVLDPDSSKDGSGLTWASRAAMERLRRELER